MGENSRNIRKRNVLIMLILFLIFIIYTINSDKYNINSPDELTLKTFSNNYINGEGLSFRSDIKESEKIVPRGMFQLKGDIVPLKFLGYIIYFGGSSLLIPNLIYFLTALSGIILLIFSYKIGKELFETNTGVSISILAFFPLTWYWISHPFFENMGATTFFFIGLYYLIKHLKTKEDKYLVLTGIFFGIVTAFRYDLLLPIIIFALTSLMFIKKNIKIILYAIITFLIFVSPSLISSKLLYGSFFTYGQMIIEETTKEIINRQLNNIGVYITAVFATIPIIFLALGKFTKELISKTTNTRKIITISSAIYAILFLFLFVYEFPLKHPNILHESYTRYFLIFYVLLTLYLASHLSKLPRKPKLIVTSAIIILSICTTLPFIQSQWESDNYGKSISKDIQDTTEKNSIIIVENTDKYIYPSREVLPIFWFRSQGELKEEELIIEINKIIEKYPVYFYSGDFEEDEIKSLLEKNYELKIEGSSPNIYKLTK